jgi:DNA-directed RNA polymerase II subunit RPB1
VDDSDFRFVRAQKLKSNAKKFNMVWRLARAKTVCVASTADGKHTHGGCGQRQPVYRITALKLSANFKAFKDEVFPNLIGRMGIIKKLELLSFLLKRF